MILSSTVISTAILLDVCGKRIIRTSFQNTDTNFTDLIKVLYGDISAGEATLAEDNMGSFFKILEQVEARLAQYKQRHEPKNEDIRNTH